MKIYKIERADIENDLSYYAEFEDEDDVLFIFSQNKPMPSDWKFPPLTKERGKRNKVDFPKLWGTDSFLLMNENAWQIVNKPLMVSGQCYSVLIKDQPHHICFPWHVIPSDNIDATSDSPYICKTAIGGRTYLDSFDPIVLNGQFPLFQFETADGIFTIESPELRKEGLDFKHLVSEHKLTGLEFQQVWESEK